LLNGKLGSLFKVGDYKKLTSAILDFSKNKKKYQKSIKLAYKNLNRFDYKLNCKQFEYSSEALDTGITTIDSIEDSESRNTRDFEFTLEQSTAQNEEINIQHARSNFGLLLEETDGDNIIGEDDETSVGTSILLENAADSGDDSYLLTEDYIVGDYVQDKTAQNELFDSLDDNVLDFSESNPFGDAGVFA